MPWSNALVVIALVVLAGWAIWCLTKSEPTEIPQSRHEPLWVAKKTKVMEEKK